MKTSSKHSRYISKLADLCSCCVALVLLSGCGDHITSTEAIPTSPIEVDDAPTLTAVEQAEAPVVVEASAPVATADDMPDEVETLREKAERGDADAQFALGMRYFEGDGVPQNDTEATKWIRRAAAQGHPAASNLLNAMTRGTTVVEVPAVPGVCGACQGRGHTGTACRSCNGTGLGFDGTGQPRMTFTLQGNVQAMCNACNGTKFTPCTSCRGTGRQ